MREFNVFESDLTLFLPRNQVRVAINDDFFDEDDGDVKKNISVKIFPEILKKNNEETYFYAHGRWVEFFRWYLNPLWQKYYEDYDVPQDERIIFSRPNWIPYSLEALEPEDVRSGYFTITAKEIQNIIEQEKEKMKTTVETTP